MGKAQKAMFCPLPLSTQSHLTTCYASHYYVHKTGRVISAEGIGPLRNTHMYILFMLLLPVSKYFSPHVCFFYLLQHDMRWLPSRLQENPSIRERACTRWRGDTWSQGLSLLQVYAYCLWTQLLLLQGNKQPMIILQTGSWVVLFQTVDYFPHSRHTVYMCIVSLPNRLNLHIVLDFVDCNLEDDWCL